MRKPNRDRGNLKQRWLITLFILVGVVCWTLPALATVISTSEVLLTGTAAKGQFTGDLIYSDISPTSATLTVDLTNASTKGGFLTAFVLNDPNKGTEDITAIELTAAPSMRFHLLGSARSNGVKASPFGQFDFGAGIASNFQGSSEPQNGLAPGSSGAFTFTLTGVGLNNLIAADFANALSFKPSNGKQAQFMVARFGGPRGADIVIGKDPPPVGSAVPIPPTALLLGSGLLGLMGWRRFRKS